MKLISPWVNFYREVEAIFAQDPEVKVVFDEENLEIKLYVEDTRKACALDEILPKERDFGKVKVRLTVIPANAAGNEKLNAVMEAFSGNPALSYTYEAKTPFGTFNYVVFANKVVQYFNDDMGDINGIRSTLYQDIARDVFGADCGLLFCTEPGTAKLQKDIGQWPG